MLFPLQGQQASREMIVALPLHVREPPLLHLLQSPLRVLLPQRPGLQEVQRTAFRVFRKGHFQQIGRRICPVRKLQSHHPPHEIRVWCGGLLEARGARLPPPAAEEVLYPRAVETVSDLAPARRSGKQLLHHPEPVALQPFQPIVMIGEQKRQFFGHGEWDRVEALLLSALGIIEREAQFPGFTFIRFPTGHQDGRPGLPGQRKKASAHRFWKSRRQVRAPFPRH